MEAKRKVFIFENSFTLTNFLLKEWGRIVNESIKDHGRCTITLSGGKTPVEFYARLSHFEEFDLWHKTHIFQVDERFVEYESKENNFYTLKENLLNYVPIPPQNIHPIKTQHENVLIATEEYKHELIYFFDLKPGCLPQFDLVLLGCGEDGHTASLHPGLDDMENPRRLTMPITTSYFKTERISLSLSAINSARYIYCLVLGARKAGIMKKIIDEKADVPANKVAAFDGEVVFLLDKEAASKLSRQRKFIDCGEAVLLE